MASKSTITTAASSPRKRMTLGELKDFLAEVDRAGIDNNAQVHATTTMTGHLKTIEVNG